MKYFDFTLRKSAVLTAGEYMKLYTNAPESIDFVRMLMPRVGIDKHFGKFEVTYTPDYYETDKDG